MNTDSSYYFNAIRMKANPTKSTKRKNSYMASNQFNGSASNLLPTSVVSNWQKFFKQNPSIKKH